MRTAKANQHAAEERSNDARRELDTRRAEKCAIEGVSARLKALIPMLEQAARALDKLRSRLTDVTNVAFDVCVFFGGLVSRTATWDVIVSAPELAAAIVRLQRLLDANTHLTGVFMTSPGVLNEGLKRLADSSNALPGEFLDLM